MKTQVITLALAIVTTLLVPLMVMLVRFAIKFSRVETKLDNAIEELRSIVADKDRVHMQMYEQMKEDRSATNLRLRWLEEHLWKAEEKGKKW